MLLSPDEPVVGGSGAAAIVAAATVVESLALHIAVKTAFLKPQNHSPSGPLRLNIQFRQSYSTQCSKEVSFA